jgi:hypothetical protein
MGVNIMKPITGTLNITLGPVTMALAAPPHTYFGVARSMLPGAQILAASTPPPAMPLSLICAHTLECALKAFLSRSGDDARLKDPKLRHNLEELWCLAADEGLGIASQPPGWVVNLSKLHTSPYYLRYSTGVHGIVLPEPQSMVSELIALLNQVHTQLFK